MNWPLALRSFEHYLLLERSLSRNSIEAYRNDVGKFAQWLDMEGRGHLSPLSVKPDDLSRFILWANRLGLEASTQARLISGLRAFYKYLMVEDLLESDPTELLESPRLRRKIPEVLSVREVEAVSLSLEIEPLQGARGVKSRDVEGGARAPWATLHCYPNPARNAASVSFEASFDGVGTLSVFDVHGKRMFAQPIEIRSGSNLAELPSERFGLLPPGVYQVALHTEEGAKTGLLVKI